MSVCFTVCPASSHCPHQCILSSSLCGSHSFCRTFCFTSLFPSVTCRMCLGISGRLCMCLIQWNIQQIKRNACVCVHMRQMLKNRGVHLLWCTDQWWLVCLPVFHLQRINPIYSLGPLTNKHWTEDCWAAAEHKQVDAGDEKDCKRNDMSNDI